MLCQGGDEQMEGGRRQGGRREETRSLTGLSSTAGDKAGRKTRTRRTGRRTELLRCHTFGESHRKQRKGAGGERTSGTFKDLTGF